MTPTEQVWQDFCADNDMIGAPFEKGRTYFLTTGRYDIIGTLRAATPTHLVLDDAQRVFESGELAALWKNGEASRSEPLPDGHIVAISWVLEASPL